MYFYQCTDVNKNQLIYKKKKKIENKDNAYIWNNFLLYTNKYLFAFYKNVPDFYGKKTS